MLLLQVAVVLMAAIFVINLVLHRSLLDSLLFSLAIAVGITPQLLPAVVSTSLAAGSRQPARVLLLGLLATEPGEPGDEMVGANPLDERVDEPREAGVRQHGRPLSIRGRRAHQWSLRAPSQPAQGPLVLCRAGLRVLTGA